MDDRRFDSLAIRVGTSRRSLLKKVVGFGGAVAVTRLGVSETEAARRGYGGPAPVPGGALGGAPDSPDDIQWSLTYVPAQGSPGMCRPALTISNCVDGTFYGFRMIDTDFQPLHAWTSIGWPTCDGGSELVWVNIPNHTQDLYLEFSVKPNGIGVPFGSIHPVGEASC